MDLEVGIEYGIIFIVVINNNNNIILNICIDVYIYLFDYEGMYGNKNLRFLILVVGRWVEE